MNRSAIVVIAAVLASSVAFAASPREELTSSLEQLQKNPADSALRERVIKLAQELKPPPAVPEEALRREGRGKFAFKNAKSVDDYLAAAKEYEEAVRVAPWVPGYYSDLCTIFEKAEKYTDAKRNCEFFMMGLTDPAQRDEIKQRIAGLEFGIEKAAKPKSELASLPGAWMQVDKDSDPRNWQALRASALGPNYPFSSFHYRFVTRGDAAAIFYADLVFGKARTPEDFWNDVFTGTRTGNDWKWQMRTADGRCGENQVFRPVTLAVLEQGNIIRTTSIVVMKPGKFDSPGQGGELDQIRRNGYSITPGPAGCLVIEIPAMFVRVGD